MDHLHDAIRATPNTPSGRHRLHDAAEATSQSERIETLAQTIHQYRHRAGTASVCGSCRDEAVRQLAVPSKPSRRSWLRSLVGGLRG